MTRNKLFEYWCTDKVPTQVENGTQKQSWKGERREEEERREGYV